MSSWLQKKAPFRESILARFRTSLPVRDEVDIDVCLESFQAHWQQAWAGMQSHQDGATVTMDEVNSVLNHTDQLRVLLCWELEQRRQAETTPGRLAELFLSRHVPERLVVWSACCGQFEPLLQAELLRVFEQLLRAGCGALLEQRALLRPLTDLLLRCRSAPSSELRRRLVLVLSQLCRALHARPPLLDLFLGLEPDGSASSFVIFSLLVEFMHGEGVVGGTAREALLLCTRLSADSKPLSEFIVQHSDFCEVLATGLSGLYSALPRSPPSDDEELPEVDAFVSSLQFCNHVLQTCHPMIAAVLLELVYQGFLVSVMGPALHQSSVEAVVTATTYLELCVRSVDQPGLVRALLRLLLRHKHDGVTVIDTLVQRIAATPRLAVATLSLLHTLLNLNCEDVLLELVLRHLLPCSHLMASQRGRVTETDLYGAGARRLLSLVPACCQPAAAGDPRATATAWLQCGREARLALVACRRATRCWTYAYDGKDPSPAEAERMARRRRGSGRSSSTPGMEERGEADGEARREEVTAVGGSGVNRLVTAGSIGSPAVDGWRLGRLQDRAEGLQPGSPLGEQRPAPGDADQASDGDGSDPHSVSSSPPSPAGQPAAAANTSVSSQLWATPSDPPPPAAGADPDPELDLSVGDVWCTPQASAAPRGRDSEADLECESLRLGILSLLPDESLSDTETSSRAGEPWSLRSGEASGREEESARRGSGPAGGAGVATVERDGSAIGDCAGSTDGTSSEKCEGSSAGVASSENHSLPANDTAEPSAGAEGPAVSGASSPEKLSGTAPVTTSDGVDLSVTVTDVSPLEGRERPAEVGEPAPAEVGEPASAEVGEPVSAEVGEPASAEVGEPAPAEVGEPASAEVREPAPAEVGELASAEVGEPAPAEVGEPAPAEVREPASAEVGEPASAEVGKPAPAEVGEPASAEVGEVPVSAVVVEEPVSAVVGEPVSADVEESAQVEVGEEAFSVLVGEEPVSAVVGETTQVEVREVRPIPPSSDLSTFVQRHRGTVRAPPPPPPGSVPVPVPRPSVPRLLLFNQRNMASDTATTVPSIGPFLLALLERLDLATTNSLQLNLLLMSVISRLSHYPQPLLRSLLLNPTLVFQPSVRSLTQTLGSLKHRIDLGTRSVQDAPGLVRWARSRLEARPAAAPAVPAASPGLGPAAAPTASPGPSSGPASLPTQLGSPVAASADGDSGGFSLSGLAGRLRRALPAVSLTIENSDQPRRRPPDTTRTLVGAEQAEWDVSERQVALTAVLLEQWLAELAAVALEHSVATDMLVFPSPS